MSCLELFMGITFFQQWEAFCCKKSQSLYKIILPSLPLAHFLAGPAFTTHPTALMEKLSAHLRGLQVVRVVPLHTPTVRPSLLHPRQPHLQPSG